MPHDVRGRIPAPQNALATLRPYQPTVRDNMANALSRVLGDGYQAQRFIENALGSRGLGATKPGAADFIPLLGQAFQGDEAGRQMAQGHRAGGMTNLLLAALPIPAAARGVNKLIRGGAKEAEKVAAPIVAYHGSPHQFDQFDASKIGSGEGAQAYGHGLYFAENEGVARTYRDALALPSGPDNDVAKFWIKEAGGDKGRAARMFTEHAASVGLTPTETKAVADTINSGGSMYEVGIHARPDEFLDWDAPANQQPAPVREALADILGDDSLRNVADASVYDARSLGAPFDPRSGESVYRALGAKKAATEKLEQAGVKGIRYRDAGSRGTDGAEATRNYVVFNPKIIEIMKRYGVTAAVASGIYAAQNGKPPRDAGS